MREAASVGCKEEDRRGPTVRLTPNAVQRRSIPPAYLAREPAGLRASARRAVECFSSMFRIYRIPKEIPRAGQASEVRRLRRVLP